MTSEQLKALIDRLLSTGEILATKGYELAYREVMVEGWMDIIIGSLVVIFLVWLTIYILKNRNSSNSFFKDMEFLAGFSGFGALAIFIATVVQGLMYILNPGWWAVHLLVKTFIQ